jgi:hypothetical protein
MTQDHPFTKIAEQVLKDERLLRKLTDRIYQLLQEEIRNQRDRTSDWRSF